MSPSVVFSQNTVCKIIGFKYPLQSPCPNICHSAPSHVKGTCQLTENIVISLYFIIITQAPGYMTLYSMLFLNMGVPAWVFLLLLLLLFSELP